MSIRIGTRGSRLARWQSDYVADRLRNHYPAETVEIVVISTKGDRVLDKSLPSIGGKGLFTEELEAALLSGEIDCAVHSLKDLPVEQPAGLRLGAIPIRAAVEDVLISRDKVALANLPEGAVIGTSSLRRASQLKAVRPDFVIQDIRGNVPTRIEKVHTTDSRYDATILARAGVERLELLDQITETLGLNMMLPAPGQGAIGIQTRDEADSVAIFAPIHHQQTAIAVNAERAFLSALGGGCAVPVAAHGVVEGDRLRLTGRVGAPDGAQVITVYGEGSAADGLSVGARLAADAIKQGAEAILAAVRG